MLESFFNKVADSDTGVFLWIYCKSFESSFFIEHLRWLLCGNCRRILKGFQLKVKIGMKWVDFEHAKHVRSSHWRCFVKKGVLKNFAKFLRTPFLQNIHSGCFWHVFPTPEKLNSMVYNAKFDIVDTKFCWKENFFCHLVCVSSWESVFEIIWN